MTGSAKARKVAKPTDLWGQRPSAFSAEQCHWCALTIAT